MITNDPGLSGEGVVYVVLDTHVVPLQLEIYSLLVKVLEIFAVRAAAFLGATSK